jgi:hypothetical protein
VDDDEKEGVTTVEIYEAHANHTNCVLATSWVLPSIQNNALIRYDFEATKPYLFVFVHPYLNKYPPARRQTWHASRSLAGALGSDQNQTRRSKRNDSGEKVGATPNHQTIC